MFKIIGGFMVGIACVLTGHMRCIRLRKRYMSLCSFRQALSVLRSEISLKMTPLAKAFGSAGEMCGNGCFVRCSEYIPEMGAESAFKRAVLETAEEECLSKSDIEALLSLSAGLGKCDMKNQIERVDYTISLVDESIKNAKKEKSEKGRMIMHCSVFLGAAIILILI